MDGKGEPFLIQETETCTIYTNKVKAEIIQNEVDVTLFLNHRHHFSNLD